MWTMIRRRSFSITTPIFALLTLAIFGLIWLPLGVLLAAWLVYAQEIKPMLLADRLHKLWLSLPTVKQYREKLADRSITGGGYTRTISADILCATIATVHCIAPEQI